MKYPDYNTKESSNSGDTEEDVAQDPSMREAIAALAYGLSKQRGPSGGSPMDDWLQAEQMVREHVHHAS